MALAVEPMVAAGSQDNVVLDDDWTVATGTARSAAHFEHTFTLTDRGAWVLTALDGGQERLDRPRRPVRRRLTRPFPVPWETGASHRLQREGSTSSPWCPGKPIPRG